MDLHVSYTLADYASFFHFKVFGIGKEEGKKILQGLGHTLLNDHEKLFGIY
jgi:hypothetical protein